MKTLPLLPTLAISLFLLSCAQPEREEDAKSPEAFESLAAKQEVELKSLSEKEIELEGDTLMLFSNYLPFYSEIFQHKTLRDRVYSLTATVSIHNVNSEDQIYLLSAELYDKSGELARSYLENPMYVNPMQTLQIMVGHDDRTGGTGGNFLFKYALPSGAYDPLVEAVMISTSGQQGLSFTTQGKKLD